LLVEFSGGTQREHYNFPGGGVELGETLEEAVRREIREETCLEVVVERLLLAVESVGSRNTNEIGGVRVPWNEVRFFFHCTPVDGSEARLPDGPDENQTAVHWFPIAQLPSLNVLPQVSDHLIAALDAGSPFRVVPNPHP
jgi:8-oxo-dGTP diphosphatase